MTLSHDMCNGSEKNYLSVLKINHKSSSRVGTEVGSVLVEFELIGNAKCQLFFSAQVALPRFRLQQSNETSMEVSDMNM